MYDYVPVLGMGGGRHDYSFVHIIFVLYLYSSVFIFKKILKYTRT